MIAAAKAALGDRVFILGHHYQRDEVMRWADARGDSYRLSVLAQQRAEAEGKAREFIVYMGGGQVYQDYCREVEQDGYRSFLADAPVHSLATLGA